MGAGRGLQNEAAPQGFPRHVEEALKPGVRLRERVGAVEPPDFDALETYFSALAYSTRLELLHLLRFPHALPEIRLSARQVRAGQNPERLISRQALQEHLDRLIQIGVVTARESESGRPSREFVVNGQRLYQIMDEFWRVGTVFAGNAPTTEGTATLGAVQATPLAPGPKLVLVRGLLEGKAFPLRRADLREGRGWIAGRKKGLHVALEYDPYVSLENSEIVPTEKGFEIMDLASSRNGTWVNWQPLPDGGRAALKSGDVIGVGRSLLVFRGE